MEIKDVKTGSVKFQVYDEATTSDYTSQIHDFELLSKSLTLANEPIQPPSVEYFEPAGIINANIIVEEKQDLENVDKEDSAEIFNSWSQLACKLEDKLEREFIEENVNLEIDENEENGDYNIKDISKETLMSDDATEWNSQMKNFEGFAKDFEKKNSRTKVKFKDKVPPNNKVCKYCGEEFSSYQPCFYHQKTVHEGVWHKCDLCDYVHQRRDYIRIHKGKEHYNVRYPCDKCDYKAKARSHLKQHDERIHQKLTFYCDICTFTCKQKTTLKYHIQRIHEGVGHQCPKCEYKSSILSRLQSHVKAVHDKIKDYQCDQCEFRTGTNRRLKLHLQLHEGVK